MIYSLTVEDVATDSAADTFKTLLALKAANTAGHRGRLLQLCVGPSDDTPADLNLAVRVNKTDNAGNGTGATSVASANIPKADPNQRDSIMTGYRGYATEPTTYDTEAPWKFDLNRRGGLIQNWDDREAPTWGPSETLGILLAPRTAAAANVTITVVWEEF